MSKAPRLTPFWYVPEGQEGEEVSFKLRPLTQPQMVDVEEHYVNGRSTDKANYIAGTLGIIEVKGIRHPETQQLVKLPDFSWLPRGWVRLCGMRLLAEDAGLDWDELMAGLVPAERSPEDDPEKN